MCAHVNALTHFGDFEVGIFALHIHSTPTSLYLSSRNWRTVEVAARTLARLGLLCTDAVAILLRLFSYGEVRMRRLVLGVLPGSFPS